MILYTGLDLQENTLRFKLFPLQNILYIKINDDICCWGFCLGGMIIFYFPATFVSLAIKKSKK